jgi:hypothetical protein
MARSMLVAGLAFAMTAGALVGSAAQEPARRPAWASFIIFDMTGDGIVLTSQATGVSFDLAGTGKPERIGWTAAGSDDALLVRDGDGNGAITSGAELLGKHFKLGNQVITNGVNALWLNLQGISVGPDGRSTDPRLQPGPVDAGLGLGQFDKNDAEFARLRLWTDANHDGKSTPGELRTLPEAGVTMVGLGFRMFTRDPAAATDAHGNRKLFSGFFRLLNRGMAVQRELVEFEPTRASTGTGPATAGKPAPKPTRFRQLREEGTSEVLVVDLDGNGVCLTSAAEGVVADPVSSTVMSSWTCAREQDAFVVFDQTEDGRIQGEILGGILGPPRAFQHLEILAKDDAQFAKLGLWIDENHDGQSDEQELQSFAHAGLESIRMSLKPAAETVKGNAITGRTLARVRTPRGIVDRGVVSVRLLIARPK